MRVLADIVPISKAQLEALAAEAPPEDMAKDEGTGKGKARKFPPRRGQRAGLGPLDVAKYLTHYGIEYTLKESDSLRLFRLKACLFDPNHKANEAAIIQDSSGELIYYCFHSSCDGHTWAEAKRMISGDASLAQFCDGFDPARLYAGASAWQAGPSVSLYDTRNEDLLPETVPAPEEVPFEHFLNGREFKPMWLARYLEKYFKPVIYDGNEFCHYRAERGVWAHCIESLSRK